MKRPGSITNRLTLTLAIMAALVFWVAGNAITAFQHSELNRYMLGDLKTRAQTAASIVKYADRPDFFKAARDHMLIVPADGSLRYIVTSPDPVFRAGQPWPADARRVPKGDGLYKVQSGGLWFLAIDRSLPARNLRPAVVVTTAVSYAPILAIRHALNTWVLMVAIAGVIALTLIGRRAVVLGLRPVERLSRSAAGLNPADLSLRLPQDALPRELAGLAAAFNGALSRLEDAYQRLAAFNADVAHELRTPLANLMGQTQVALSRRRSVEDLEEVLQTNLEDLDRLRGIINDMLFLARADQGALADSLMPQPIAAIVEKTAEFMDVVLEEAGVQLVTEGDAVAPVEPQLLGRALTNLIDNAVRHGARPGVIRVMIEPLPGEVRIAVHNQGGDLAQHQLERLFDRFYRPDPSREGSSETHGLGLAIVKAIAIMHRGEVFARCEGGEVVVGLTVRSDLIEEEPDGRS